jgi:hypothetical protein
MLTSFGIEPHHLKGELQALIFVDRVRHQEGAFAVITLGLLHGWYARE